MDLKKFLLQHSPKAPPPSILQPIEVLKSALERDLSLLQKIRPRPHPLTHLIKIWFSGSPEDGGTPFLFLHVPGHEGHLFELKDYPTCHLRRARFVNPIVETPLSRESKPLLIRKPQTAHAFTFTPPGTYTSLEGNTLTANGLSEKILEGALEDLLTSH